MPIHEGMMVYKNKAEKRPAFATTADFPTHGVHETKVHLDVHTGTHIDAPLHMLPGGATIDQLDVRRLVRPVRVLDLTDVQDAIHADDLVRFDPQPDDFLLLKTRNSFAEAFDFEFVYVAEDAARLLAERRVAGVGVDGLGIERGQPGHPTHKTLFQAGVVIVEGVWLREVPAGSYWMIALPLPLVGADASPARILLAEA
ncbi:cyclase family protein [Alicyclobacillus cellulosilyticus]|nr:cyclase family protein [Alicyclobacillus cellulosilyticus]